MNTLVPVNQTRNLATADLAAYDGFSASMIRKALKAQHPDWTAKQLRTAVNDQLDGEQAIALANFNEAIRQGWKFRRETFSKSRNSINVTLRAPSKASSRKPSLSTLSVEDIIAELQRRGVAVA